MFRPLTRIPLRRSLHTTAQRTQPRTRLALALGASAATAYAAWRLTSDGQRIRLDAQGVTSAPRQPPLSSPKTNTSTISEPASSSSFSSSTTQYPPSEPIPPIDEPSSESPSLPPSNPSPDQTSPTSDEPEQSSGGAFNPVTGEINWDCPCLGGMAHGPCGPEFREAFSCFVYSEQEPKGIDCVEKFRGMQDCFRRHPDIYGDEIMDDDDEEQAASDVANEIDSPSDSRTQSNPVAGDSSSSPPPSSDS